MNNTKKNTQEWLHFTAKQKILFLANAYAYAEIGNPILSTEEFDTIALSLKDKHEKDLLMHTIEKVKVIQNWLLKIQIRFSMVKESILLIILYDLEFKTQSIFIDVINDCLKKIDYISSEKFIKHFIKESKTANLEAIATDEGLMLCLEPQSDISDNEENLNQNVIELISMLKGHVKALEDYMSHTGLEIEVYKSFLTDFMLELRRTITETFNPAIITIDSIDYSVDSYEITKASLEQKNIL